MIIIRSLWTTLWVFKNLFDFRFQQRPISAARSSQHTRNECPPTSHAARWPARDPGQWSSHARSRSRCSHRSTTAHSDISSSGEMMMMMIMMIKTNRSRRKVKMMMWWWYSDTGSIDMMIVLVKRKIILMLMILVIMVLMMMTMIIGRSSGGRKGTSPPPPPPPSRWVFTVNVLFFYAFENGFSLK